MLSWLGLQPSEAIAVGDYLNDLAVFEGFDQVMCPANAHEKIIALTKQKGEGSYVSNDSYGASMIDFFQRML